MQFSFEGKLTAISPIVEVLSQKGEKMNKRSIILEEVNAQYPESVAVTLWNEKATEFRHNVGDLVKVNFSCRAFMSREGDRFFTELKAWRVD